MKRLLVFFMAITFAIQGWSQTIPITIGTGTTSASTSALPGLYGYNISAHLYSASEVGVGLGGSIESLEYNISSTISGTGKRVKIYLIEITDASINLNQSWTTLTSSATLVYDSTSFYTPTSGWKKFAFSSPFSYTGTGNLLVLTEGTGCTTSGGCSMTIFTNPGLVSNCFNRYKDSTPLSFTTNLSTLTEGSGNITNRANIKLNIVPNPGYCYPAIDLISSNITTNSADFSWTTHATGNSWVIQHKPSSDTNWSIEEYVNTGFYSLQSLNSDAAYKFRVKSICDISESAWNTITFRTACDIISTLPFNESFDAYGTDAFLTCWSKISSNTNPSLNTTNYSSPKSMYFYTASGAHNYLITPEFDASIPINSLSANFYLRKSTLAYNITVGVMSDPSDTTTFDSLINLTPTAINSWQVFNVDFIDYTGTGQYIAFKVQGYGAANGMYLDDLIIYTTPSCAIPTGITRQNTTSNSFDLDWDNTDDANCIGWIIDYKEHDATVWQEEFVTSHPHTLANLSPNTLYNIRLRAICSSGDTTQYTSVLTFGMPCESISVFPWEEGFEDSWWIGDGLGGTTDSRPWCWININGGASTSYKWQKTSTSSYVHSGAGAAQMYAANTTGLLGDWLITPAFSLTGNQRLRFWAKGYSTYTDILTVKILDLTTNPTVSSASDTSLFVELMSNTVIPASDWTEYEINLSDFTGDYRFAFVRNTTGGYYLNLDDVSISDIPACARPTAINTGYVIDEEIELSWISGNPGDAAWYLYWKAASATDYDSVYVTQQPYVLQNLTANTTYNIYLRTDCLTELSEATNPISIKTALCAPVTTFPYTEGFDSLGATAGAFPPCWARPVIYNTYPKTSTAAAKLHSAPASLEIHSAVGSPTYAVTPPMGEDINTLRVTFWAMAENTTSSGTLEVGVMSDPNNLSTFESVQIIQPANTSYNQYEVIFSGTTLNGLNKSIAFRQNTVSSVYYYWIDDIEVDYIPICSKPASVVVSNITTTSADITWVPANAADNAWWLYYKTSAATSYDSIYITGTPTYSLTTLAPNTLYNIYLTTDCGTELSEPTAVSNFRTACAAISTLPFFENFDTYGTGTSTYPLPNCWSRINTYTSSTMPYISTTNHSAPGSLYFYTPTSGTYNIGIMPPFDASIPVNTLMATFYYRNNSATDRLIIGAMSDPTDATTFDSITTITASATATWEFFEVNLSSYNGIGQYLAFKNTYTTANSYAYIDDLTISTIPTCPNTYSLQVASVTSTDITLNWNETNSVGQGWEVSYDAVGTGFDPTTGIIIPVADAVGVPPYTIQGLTPSTPYSFAVRQACGGNWSNIVTVNTMGLPAQLPYSCDFENVSEINSWSISNGGATNKWFIGTAVSATPITGNSLYISNDNGVSNAYTLTTISTVVASRLIEFDGAGGYTLTFNSKLGGESSFDYIKVYVVDQDTTFVGDASTPYYGSNSYSTGVVLFNGTNAYFNNVSNPTTVNNHSVVIPYQGVAGTVRKLMFVWRNDVSGGTTPPASIDNITITPITCAAPVLTISNIAQTTADASWTATATDAAWWLYWKQASATNYDSVYLTGVPSYSFTTLTANTAYNAYVRLDCGTELSNPSAIVDFRTTCAPVATLPYIENFDTYGTASNTLPACWNKITTYSTYPYLSTTNNSAPASLYFYATTGTYNIATTPPIDVSIPINTLMATFQMRKGSATSNLIVGVMTDPTDATTFDSITTVSPSATVVWEEFEVNFSSYTGTGTYIAFKSQYNTATNYFYLDDLVIDIIPSCARPISATATNITGTTADLSWTPGNASDFAWKIYYRPSGTSDWDSVMVTNNPYNLTGLLPSTNYEVGISTDCGTGEFSNMRLMNFRTQCGAITSLPWTDNFDSYGTGTTIFPGCWTRNTTYADRPHVHATSYSSPGSLYFYSATAGTYNIAATPMFDQTINISSVRASFMFRNMNATDTLKVGVMTDPSQESTWVEVGRVSHSSAQVWVADTISFANYTGTGQYIAFRIDRYSTTSQWSWMDDLVIEYDVNSNPCPQPTNVVVIPSNASANVTWSIGAESAWEVRLGTTGTPIAVSTPSYTIPALSPGTTYTVYVRSNCGTGYSAWVSAQFTTNTDPTPPTVTTAVPTTMISQTTAVFNGTYVQTTDAILTKGFEYKAASAATWTNEVVTDGTTPFTFSPTGLVANTAYEVKAYVTTATFNTTYGNTVAFTTLETIAPTVTTDSVKVLSETSATFYGKITQNTEAIEARGFEYKLSSQAWADAINISATGVTEISATPTTLTLGSYNVRAYARTLSGTEYGQVLTFQTQGLDGIDGQDISIMMYPNPATSQTNLIVNGINGETKIILSDVQGRILNTMSAKPVSGTIEQTIDLNNLAKGVYYIRIQNSDINRTQKLIVK